MKPTKQFEHKQRFGIRIPVTESFLLGNSLLYNVIFFGVNLNLIIFNTDIEHKAGNKKKT